MGYETLADGIHTTVVLLLAVAAGYVLGAARPWIGLVFDPDGSPDHVTALASSRDRARVQLMRLKQRLDPQRPNGVPLTFYDRRTGIAARRRAWGRRA